MFSRQLSVYVEAVALLPGVDFFLAIPLCAVLIRHLLRAYYLLYLSVIVTTNNRVKSAAISGEYAAGQGGGSTSVTLYITSINFSPSNGRFRAASSYSMHPADLLETKNCNNEHYFYTHNCIIICVLFGINFICNVTDTQNQKFKNIFATKWQ